MTNTIEFLVYSFQERQTVASTLCQKLTGYLIPIKKLLELLRSSRLILMPLDLRMIYFTIFRIVSQTMITNTYKNYYSIFHLKQRDLKS